MARERQATARGVAALPLLLMATVHMTVTPLRQMFEVEPRLAYVWYLIAVVLGIILFRKTKTVKDHEFHRSKIMKSMKKVYDAEEAGVWQTNVPLGSDLGPEGEVILSQNVSAIDNESPEMELHEDEKVEVDLLLESERIRKSNRGRSSDVNYDERVDSTIGSTRRKSPMDSFLDMVTGLFGRGDAKERRLEQRQAALLAASKAAPVVAQRPVAPIRKMASASDSELKIATLSDDGMIESVVSNDLPPLSKSAAMDPETAKVYAWDTPTTSTSNTSDESIEAMAMLSPLNATNPQPQQVTVTPTGTMCRGCNAIIPQGEPFCLSCGLDA